MAVGLSILYKKDVLRIDNFEAVNFDGGLFDLGDGKFVLVGGGGVYGRLLTNG
jgi:hypothetical protein